MEVRVRVRVRVLFMVRLGLGLAVRVRVRPAARLQADERGGEAGEECEHAQVGGDVGAFLLQPGRQRGPVREPKVGQHETRLRQPEGAWGRVGGVLGWC